MAGTAAAVLAPEPALDPAAQRLRAAVELCGEAGLVYVCDRVPGIRRRRCGRGFSYLDSEGLCIRDPATIRRIRALAIPPAYRDVWICSDPRGHLQATGRDARGRKQYRYHPDWLRERDTGKFHRLVEFGAQLPALRRRVARDLARPGLPREKSLALVVSLLERTLIRIGSDDYARSNRSYGLTTLCVRHVEVGRDRLVFRFRGKGGIEHEIELGDPRVARLVRELQQLPGQRLFQYLDDDGQCQPLDSGAVNAYLHLALGEGFTAKDFRTWAGTFKAASALAAAPVPATGGKRARNGVINQVVREVAAELGNTPAVCRRAYIDPAVFETWLDGRLQQHLPPDCARAPRRAEAQLLGLLRAQRQA